MPLGPMALYDLIGIDTAFYAGRTMWEAFPDRIDASGADALGPLPVTPIGSAVAQTVDLLRALQADGRLDPLEHGLPAA